MLMFWRGRKGAVGDGTGVRSAEGQELGHLDTGDKIRSCRRKQTDPKRSTEHGKDEALDAFKTINVGTGDRQTT